jgi:hypothetical protein
MLAGTALSSHQQRSRELFSGEGCPSLIPVTVATMNNTNTAAAFIAYFFLLALYWTRGASLLEDALVELPSIMSSPQLPSPPLHPQPPDGHPPILKTVERALGFASGAQSRRRTPKKLPLSREPQSLLVPLLRPPNLMDLTRLST